MLSKKLAIGICAYKRPEMLIRCLHSLNNMIHPEDLYFCLLIADNDVEASSKAVVEEFRLNTNIDLYYQVESGRGIPYARNNILKQAKELGITELAFIDDDEYVDKNWLVNFWNYYIKSEVDVVRGLVKTDYPEDTPNWIVNGQFHQRINYHTGKVFTWSNTGNVLFNYSKLVGEWDLDFDESYGLKGGSDKDFFSRAYSCGAKIIWVDNAIIFETLVKERYKISYLIKRKFRIRNNRIHYDNIGIKKWLWFLKRSIKEIVKGLFTLPINCFKGKHKVIQSLVYIVLGVARILGLLKIHIEWKEYK